MRQMSRRDERFNQEAIDCFVRRLLEPESSEIDFGVPARQKLKVAIKGAEEICRTKSENLTTAKPKAIIPIPVRTQASMVRSLAK